MKIESIHIENFRAFKDETIYLNDYTCLVGPNGGGKSTILSALNLFFQEKTPSLTNVSSLSEEDFYQKDTSKPIKITVTFKDLTPEAQEDFKAYFRGDKLIVSAVAEFDENSQQAPVKQYGQRLIMAEFGEYFREEKSGALVEALRSIYSILQQSFELPDAKTKSAMIENLNNYENTHLDKCVLQESGDQFYGVSKGKNLMEKYLQWVYIPAVKDITPEQDESSTSVLGKLLARTVRLSVDFDEDIKQLRESAEKSYLEILSKNKGALSEVEQKLLGKLCVWAHPSVTLKLDWRKEKKSVQIEEPLAKTIVGEGGFEGDLSRLGNGFQRSYFLAILELLSEINNDTAPRLLLGCEEPELYQHPPQARQLATVLQQLSEQNNQIVLTTHSPLFVNGKDFESVRLIRFDSSAFSSTCSSLTFDEVSTRMTETTGKSPVKPIGVMVKLHQILQPNINEIFFTQKLVLVEGLEDLAYITSWLMLTDKWDETRKSGISIIPVNGKNNIPYVLTIAQGFNIPVFTIFDADGDDTKGRSYHEVDNKKIITLLGGDPTTPFPANTVWENSFIIWPNNIGDTFENEIDKTKLDTYKAKACAAYGSPGGLEKNSLFIASLLESVFKDGTRPTCLDGICDSILKF